MSHSINNHIVIRTIFLMLYAYSFEFIALCVGAGTCHSLSFHRLCLVVVVSNGRIVHCVHPWAECYNLENSKWPINWHKWSKFNCDEFLVRSTIVFIAQNKLKNNIVINCTTIPDIFTSKKICIRIHTTHTTRRTCSPRSPHIPHSIVQMNESRFFLPRSIQRNFFFGFSEIIFLSLFLFIDAFIGRVYRFRLVWYVNMR